MNLYEARPVSRPSIEPHHHVLWLDDELALRNDLVGEKAATLAQAASTKLPVLEGFVVTTSGTDALERGARIDELRKAWDQLSRSGSRPLVVRSSSTAEDLGDSSMAGRFESVTDVETWNSFEKAVATVIESRHRVEGEPLPLAVLVQPLVRPRAGGVMFGVDPVTGREDVRVIAAVRGAPEKLVSGRADATTYHVDPEGRPLRYTDGREGVRLRRREIRALVSLAQRVADIFGGYQDVEWAIDRDGGVFLLQTRPVTTPVLGVPEGPVMTAGPVAETFPDPLSRLETDLWLPPLRESVAEAIKIAGVASSREVEASPVVTSVDGRLAVDAELLGLESRTGGLLARVDPRSSLRRLYAGWRVGRLRVALPQLAKDALAAADEELAKVPPLDELTDLQLVGVLERSRPALRSLHGYEMLIGLLLDPSSGALTAASVALRVLAANRDEGMSDAEVIAREPVVLALCPPAIPPRPVLPKDGGGSAQAATSDEDAAIREALRLRVRWVHELTARVAAELGRRFAEAERVRDPADIRHVSLADLRDAANDRAAKVEPVQDGVRGEPLPARFRISNKGHAIAVDGGGVGPVGASSGTARGRAHVAEATPPEGSVLVVRHLDPALASVLPSVAAIVAETGSPLSHVAILAREQRVPVVVGFATATERFRSGQELEVDGTSGEVSVIEEERAQ